MRKTIVGLVALVLVAVFAVFGYRVWERSHLRGALSDAEQDLKAGRYAEAAKGFESLWEQDASNVKAIAGLIESKFRLNAFREVVDIYARTERVPGFPPQLVTYKAWSEFHLADIDADRRGQWFERAKASFEAAVVRDSRNPEAYSGRGWISLQESGLDLSSPMTGFRPLGGYLVSEVDLAEKNFRQALELSRGHPEASRGLAIIAHSQGRTGEVGRLFEGLAGPRGPDFLLTRSLILLSLDPKQAEAVKAAMEGLGSVPYASQRALRYCLMGIADYLLGDLESAERQFRNAGRNDGGVRYPTIRLHLAKVEEAQRKWASARASLEELQKESRFRRDPSLLFLVALNAYHRGDESEMEWYLKQVEVLRPSEPDVLLLRASEELDEADRRDLYLRILDVDSDNFVARYNLGTIRLRRLEDMRSAIEDFRIALRTRPDFRDGRLNLANALRQAEMYDQAAKEYRQLLEQWPDLGDAKLGLALVLLEQGDREGAVSLLEQVTREGTLGAMAQLLLARGALADGETSKAIEFAERAVSLDASSYQARNFLGNLYLEANEPAKAIPHFREAMRNPNDASFPDAVNGLAVAYFLQEKYSEALDTLERVIRRAEEWGNAAAFFVNRGNVFFRQQEYPQAESDYRKAQEQDPGSWVAYYNMGVLRERMRQWERARSEYSEALTRQPAASWAHLNLGNLYAAIPNRQSAIEQYRRATEDNPELDEAYVNLAIQLIDGRDYTEAVEYLERAAERSPRSTVIHNALAIIYLQMDNLGEAEAECTRSLEVDPLNATARLLKGLVRMGQSRFNDAYGLLNNIPPTQDLDLPLRTSLGITRVELEKVGAGIRSLEGAVELARGSRRGGRFLADALINLSWGLLHAGEYSEALQALQEAKQYMEPRPSSDVLVTLKKLEKV